ncbi:MAG: energy-coupling factor ABC transporter substrate-binding protein [Chloroflexi bacterium]|nr:energy-coupling factor ABC transporter substrate-binding protein [Chloroflexota bacterium]
MLSWKQSLLLSLVAVALVGLPLVLDRDRNWQGADDRGTSLILELRSDYAPWFEPLFDPRELEPYLFGLQALLGTAAAAGAFGWLVGRSEGSGSSRSPRIAVGLAIIATVLFCALLTVRHQSGEIQAFVAALQGVCLGQFAFFLGFSRGRRQASRPAASAR